jgi:hypothetical protein
VVIGDFTLFATVAEIACVLFGFADDGDVLVSETVACGFKLLVVGFNADSSFASIETRESGDNFGKFPDIVLSDVVSEDIIFVVLLLFEPLNDVESLFLALLLKPLLAVVTELLDGLDTGDIFTEFEDVVEVADLVTLLADLLAVVTGFDFVVAHWLAWLVLVTVVGFISALLLCSEFVLVGIVFNCSFETIVNPLFPIISTFEADAPDGILDVIADTVDTVAFLQATADATFISDPIETVVIFSFFDGIDTTFFMEALVVDVATATFVVITEVALLGNAVFVFDVVEVTLLFATDVSGSFSCDIVVDTLLITELVDTFGTFIAATNLSVSTVGMVFVSICDVGVPD